MAPPRKAARPSRDRSTATTEIAVDRDVERPDLPTSALLWHPRTKEFWDDVWSSPMASQYVKADHQGLFALAVLVDAYWRATSQLEKMYSTEMDPYATLKGTPDAIINTLTKLSAEIRMQRACFGLTPKDRGTLKWEIARGEAAARETRRNQPDPSEPPKLSVVNGDPREMLFD